MSKEPHHKDKIVCECLKISESEILKAIKTHKIKNIKDIIHFTEAGGGCTYCHPALREYLEMYGESSEKSP